MAAVAILLAAFVLTQVAAQLDNVTLPTDTIATTLATPTPGPTVAIPSTTAPTTAPTLASLTTAATPALNSTIPQTQRAVSSYYCDCDLSESSCDYNCCCDTDCTNTERQYLTACSTSAVSTIPQRDSYQCSVWNSLFCVYRDNVQKLTIYEDTPDTESFTIIRDPHYFKWTVDPNEPMSKWFNQPTYKYGSPVFITQGGRIDTLSVPGSWNSPSCNSHNPILFLQNSNSECKVRISDLSAMCEHYDLWSAPKTVQNISIFQYPYLANKNNIDNVDTLVPLRIRQCLNKTFCQETDSLNSPVWDDKQKICTSVLQSIAYRFHFNATVGTVKVFADIQFQNLSESSEFASLKFRASFAEGTPFHRSGNPGYLYGKPVLAGILNSNGSVENVTSLTVFKISPLHKNSVLFGWDSYDAVELSQAPESDSNSTENRCNFWRETIVSSLVSQKFENISSLRIGRFADGHRNQVEDWLPVTYEEDLKNCHCGHFSLQIRIAYARVGLAANPQNKIRSFHVNLTSTETKRSKPRLTTVVKFVDTTVNPAVVLPRPPRIRVSLPKDFFYPFLMSSSSRLVPCVSVAILTFLRLIFSQ